MTIGEVARETGLAPSAIRYYEGLGLLPKPKRVGGKRRYDAEVLDAIALVTLAREAGFTMQEIRQLVAGFAPGTKPAERWGVLARRKLEELEEQAARLERMRRVLRHALDCGCLDLRECAPILAEGVQLKRRGPA